jgi:hypothetical protein
MKKVNLKGKLSLSKETISKFEMGNVTGGGKTLNYSECGTGMQTIICCATLDKTCGTDYIVCGTGPATLKGC